MFVIRITLNIPFSEIHAETYQAHLARIELYKQKGEIVANGAFLDGSGGMILYKGSEQGVRAYIDDDPLVKSGAVDVDIKGWDGQFV